MCIYIYYIIVTLLKLKGFRKVELLLLERRIGVIEECSEGSGI